jgi:hypothetical protein
MNKPARVAVRRRDDQADPENATVFFRPERLPRVSGGALPEMAREAFRYQVRHATPPSEPRRQSTLRAHHRKCKALSQ